ATPTPRRTDSTLMVPAARWSTAARCSRSVTAPGGTTWRCTISGRRIFRSEYGFHGGRQVAQERFELLQEAGRVALHHGVQPIGEGVEVPLGSLLNVLAATQGDVSPVWVFADPHDVSRLFETVQQCGGSSGGQQDAFTETSGGERSIVLLCGGDLEQGCG